MAEGETRKPRTLVLCFDGTQGQYDEDNTNVVRFFSLLRKDCCDEQLCYYQAGVGTILPPGVWEPAVEWLAKTLDLAFAWYLNQHVMDGYRYLMQNYKPGDKICLFGFSRGAYTARALAGMLYKVGLLPRDNLEQILFAFKLYVRTDEQGEKLAAGFKQTYCQNVTIEFVGAWDTVSSVGLVMGKTLPFVNSNRAIKVFRHALALDEHRARFRPNLYHRPVPGAPGTIDPGHNSPILDDNGRTHLIRKKGGAKDARNDKHASSDGGLFHHFRRKPVKEMRFTEAGIEVVKPGEPETSDEPETDVLEVWFPGAHSDVGGGEVANEVAHSLANQPLLWMTREVMKAQCGVQFERAAFARLGFPPFEYPSALPSPAQQVLNLPVVHTGEDGEAGPDVTVPNGHGPGAPGHSGLGKLSNDAGSNTANNAQFKAAVDEENWDREDALSPIYDQLKTDKIWWLLEIMPLNYVYQDAEGNWHKTFGCHKGAGRVIEGKAHFHVSVKTRMEALGYKPEAEWEGGEGAVVWVE
ncbi:hypothetical protein GGG16DRAFT_89900 [Schizophyllum commune]